MNITLDVSPELEGQLQQAARAQGTDVTTYLLDSALLQIINVPLAPEARSQRDALLAEQAQRELTAEEQTALAGLIDAVEMANAGRWQALAALARLRGLSLAEITRDLEIPLS